MISKKIAHVFEQAIPYYEDAIKNCPEDGWLPWLRARDLHDGVRYYSMLVLEKNILDERYPWRVGYWHKTPNQCKTYSEAIATLQSRVDAMRRELKEYHEQNNN